MANFRKNQSETDQEKGREKAKVEMKKFRANMTEEDQEAYKEKDRLRQVTFRYKIESFDEKDLRLFNERERKDDVNDKRSEEEVADQREFCRQAMEKSRDNQLEEIKEFAKIEEAHKRRLVRGKMTLEKQTELKAKAKQGMSLFRKEGRLRKYAERTRRNKDELTDWTEYKNHSHDYSQFLELVKPDVVQKINKKERAEKEKRATEKEKRAAGKAEKDLYDRNKVLNDKGSKRTAEEEAEHKVLDQKLQEKYMKGMKEEDMKKIKAIGWESISGELDFLYDCRELVTTESPKEFSNLRRKINAEYRKQFPKFPKGHMNYVDEDGGCPGLKEHLQRAKNEKMLKMKDKDGDCSVKQTENNLDVSAQGTANIIEDSKEREGTDQCSSVDGEDKPRTLCEYEKLREENIKERMDKMAESDYFNDLSDFKFKIGLYKS